MKQRIRFIKDRKPELCVKNFNAEIILRILANVDEKKNSNTLHCVTFRF